ncbi:hypothetical protein PENSPDRAFT_319554 [Peniophora sp. CONT]|nr:hypothetical protein PENSPDRAFT_319554 [Peniophora sp. CONT]
MSTLVSPVRTQVPSRSFTRDVTRTGAGYRSPPGLNGDRIPSSWKERRRYTATHMRDCGPRVAARRLRRSNYNVAARPSTVVRFIEPVSTSPYAIDVDLPNLDAPKHRCSTASTSCSRLPVMRRLVLDTNGAAAHSGIPGAYRALSRLSAQADFSRQRVAAGRFAAGGGGN